MARSPIIPLATGDSYRRFSLSIEHARVALLPTEHDLLVHTGSGRFSVVHRSTEHVAGEGIFSLDALPVILVLLDHWPSYVQNHKLMHALGNANGSDADPRLDDEQQILDRVHHLVTTSRPTLQSIGIDIQPISDVGYKLGKYTESQADHQEEG